MKFSCPLYAVRSMERARAFYEGVLGQTVILDHGTNVTFSGGFALQQDFDQLVGFPPEKLRWNNYDGELYFETEALDADTARLQEAGVELLHETKEYPWGQRVLRFFDPDGHVVELGESMASVILRFLAQGMTPEEAAVRSQHPLEFVLACRDGKLPEG